MTGENEKNQVSEGTWPWGGWTRVKRIQQGTGRDITVSDRITVQKRLPKIFPAAIGAEIAIEITAVRPIKRTSTHWISTP
jgi:hypothetical protein